MSLQEFLQYASTSAGVNFLVGFALSFLAEWLPGYESLDAKIKRVVMILLSFAIPVLATALLGCFTAECIWQAVMAGATAFFGSQAAHVRKL